MIIISSEKSPTASHWSLQNLQRANPRKRQPSEDCQDDDVANFTSNGNAMYVDDAIK